MPAKKPLTILLASPRGFCAGVDRAIQIVERAIERYGRPVYVRHEIVHNRYVVENLEAKGAVFVDELDEVPNDRPVVFSAQAYPSPFRPRLPSATCSTSTPPARWSPRFTERPSAITSRAARSC
jgi:4-hydroxy-3-methylbut-2-enyl diphosphate reductase IspH